MMVKRDYSGNLHRTLPAVTESVTSIQESFMNAAQPSTVKRSQNLPLFCKPIAVLSFAMVAIPYIESLALADATTQPLVQGTDISFVGKFGITNAAIGCQGFTYGGRGMSFWKDGSGRKTLFMQGHDYRPECAGQVQVPADAQLKSAATNYSNLTMATVLQAPAVYSIDPSGVNRFGGSGLDSNNGNPIVTQGFLVYNGRLIITAQNTYSFYQTASIASKGSTTLSAPDFSSLGFQGFSSAVTANPRSASGYIFLIPPEWRGSTLFNAPAMTGNCCWSVISTSSGGPALTTFNPDDVGVVNPVPGKTVLHYQTPTTPVSCPTDGACQSNVFNLTSRVIGGGFVPNTRTVFFVEGHGTGPYCYGTAAECGNDTVMSDVKGPHAQPYRYQILAYDANELISVKNGTLQTHQPRPYNQASPWVLPELDGNDPRGHGAAFDPETGRLYVRVLDGNSPQVYVYQFAVPIGGPVTVSPVTLPTPGTLRIVP